MADELDAREELRRLLAVTDALVDIGAEPNSDVRDLLAQALDYVTKFRATDDDTRETQVVVRQQLTTELDQISRLEPSAPVDPRTWQRQRNAIERGYAWGFTDADRAQLVAAQAQARADVANNLLKKAGGAAAGLGEGIGEALKVIVVLVGLLIVLQLLGAGRKVAAA